MVASSGSMRPHLTTITLALVAVVLTGANECEPTLVAPKGGSVVVENILSPVRIHTSKLEGVGTLEALLPDGNWTLIHFAPNGAFIYDEPLPPEVWHCADPSGNEGCVARLRIGHEEGPVGFNAAFGEGIVHVCTENYVQRMGRTHCGTRELEHVDGNGDEPDIPLPAAASLPVEKYVGSLEEGMFSWSGDPWNRLIWGTHVLPHLNANTPPTGDAAAQVSGFFFDYAWDADSDPISIGLGAPSNAHYHAYSMDLGACSFFIPWEWEHRLGGAYYTAGLGAALEDRGLAELFLDEMHDTREPQSQTEVNALLWIDAVVGIRPNESASPEFHYRLSDTGEPQICFKQYFHANSDISTKPDHWYRFDQAIGAFFLELLPFIGSCGDKNMSIFYCGSAAIEDGLGTFTIDTSSVHVAHQGYPWGKTVCNNQFVPQLIDGIRDTFEPGGEGASQIDEGVAVLVDSLGETLGLQVRRFEMSPRGVYLVTAEDTADPQYGMGDCRADLDRAPSLPSASRRTEINIFYPARGVTRF
jgi:hypothetical protein